MSEEIAAGVIGKPDLALKKFCDIIDGKWDPGWKRCTFITTSGEELDIFVDEGAEAIKAKIGSIEIDTGVETDGRLVLKCENSKSGDKHCYLMKYEKGEKEYAHFIKPNLNAFVSGRFILLEFHKPWWVSAEKWKK